MAVDNNTKLRLYKDVYSEAGSHDEDQLAAALLTQQDTLSPTITHLLGRVDQRFPLSFLTEGVGAKKYLKSIEFDYPVIGKNKKANLALSLVEGNGLNHSFFKVEFKDKIFSKKYIIESAGGKKQARIKDSGEPGGPNGGFVYTMQLNTTDPNATVTAADFTSKHWTQGWSVNAFSGSTGNESRWYAPSKLRNQMHLIRKSREYEGNYENAIVNFEFNVKGKKTKLWQDWEEHLYMLEWFEEIESSLWYSTYNRDGEGKVHLVDDNGKPIPTGSGVLEQIGNKDSYSKLTAKKLKSVVRDAVFGASDSQAMNIILYTGTGGMEEFDNAMKEEVSAGTYIKNTDPAMFMRGGSEGIQLGGFFTSYKHVDGHTITVRKLPMLDTGGRAENPDRVHPETGLPLESYRMIFLDQSVYDGEQNIQMVTRKDREFIRWAVAGATVPKGFNGNDTRANDIDGASVHFLKECGIQIKRATNCIDLECIAA